MKIRFLKTFLAVVVILSMTVSLIGCGKTTENKPSESTASEKPASDSTKEEKPAEEVKKPVVLKVPTPYVGTDKSAMWHKQVVEEFQTKYGNEIKLEIEEVPGSQNYVDKIKVLLSANQLPDIVFTHYNLLDLAVKAGKAVDLTPYLDADSEWKGGFDPSSLTYNTFDGKVYGLPYLKRLIGYYYNTEHFEKAGVKPAETWDEFFENCEKLKNAGITPLSMDTGDTGWLSSLVLISMIATSGDKGCEFMNTSEPKDYNFPEFIDAAKKLQILFQKYTTKDAIGGKYENGATNFFAGKTAIIANGTWMVQDFSDTSKAPAGFDKKVGVAIYPNKGVFFSPGKGNFCASQDKEHADAAVKFLKHMTSVESQQKFFIMTGESPESPKIQITDEIKNTYPLVAQLFALAGDAKYKYGYAQSLWYANVTDQLSTLYPLLATGKMTPEEFAKKLTETAQKNQ